MDRAIVIRMRRRGPGEKVAPFRTRRDAPPLRVLRDRITEWVRGNLFKLGEAVPVLPVEDRAADTWEPLFAIADLAGGDWPQRANRACLALTGTDPDEAADGTRLLGDLKAIWAADEDHLFTTTIIERLRKIEESPWNEWGPRHETLTARGLAELLRPYRVKPKTVRTSVGTAKGYSRADLTDPWTRYVTDVTASQEHEKGDPTSENTCDGSVTDDDSRTDTASDKDKQADCDGVTDVSDNTQGGATTNGHRTQCRTCGGELRPHLQDRGTCGPCHFKAGGAQ
jgi:Protein of unknown function (DUF3631)